ncbi:MAG: hypothetical protein ACLFTT_09725 [Candidatus Hydrogenedentota bacterium]
MTRTTRLGSFIALLLAVAMSDAAAWDARAQRTIAYMSLQVIQEDYPDILRQYDRDILRGAKTGYEEFADTMPLSDADDAVAAVGAQIQLLRNVREYGVNSYFAFRMGVLSSLVADVMVPFGFAWTPQEQSIQARMEEDIEAHLDNYRYVRADSRRTYVRNAQAYFYEKRRFHNENKQIIAEDYTSGAGYAGLLRNAGQDYFNKAINAVADTWHTVLRSQADATDQEASPTMLTWYFVKEIAYFLEVQENFQRANRAYELFQRKNPGILRAYEEVGDLYYAFGSEQAVERGVNEWKLAYSLRGSRRKNVGEKLSAHYMRVGREYFDKERYDDTDLPNALDAFQEALKYNRADTEAADYVQQVNRKIKEREELRELYLEIISKAEAIREEASRAALEGDYGTAIIQYRKGINLFESVGDEFDNLAETADSGVSDLTKDMDQVIQEIINKATGALDEGEAARDDRRYDEAIRAFERVPSILDEIPEDVSQSQLEDKRDLQEMSEQKIQEAKREKAEFERRQREAQQAQQAGGGGGGGGGGG